MLRTSIAQGPAPTVYLAGEMDLDCADTLREAVSEAARGAQMVALDFDGVEFIDSSGTGIFVRLALDLKSQGTPLVARNLSPAVRGVLDSCGCANSSAMRSSRTSPDRQSGPGRASNARSGPLAPASTTTVAASTPSLMLDTYASPRNWTPSRVIMLNTIDEPSCRWLRNSSALDGDSTRRLQ